MNPLPPGLRGYAYGEQAAVQRKAQELGMLAELARLQGQMENRALQQSMAPLQIQGMLADIEAKKDKARESADKRAFFSPQNTAQYVEGGRPAFSLPDEVQGPRQGAEPGRMNFDRLLQDAASRGFVNPETYANHQAQRENQRQQIIANHEARMAGVQAQLFATQQRSQDAALSREQRADLAQQANELRAQLSEAQRQTQLQLAQMQIQGRQDLAAFSVANRQPPAPTPLESVIGPDGKPVLLPRDQAVGKQPAPRNADNTGAPRLSPTAQKEVFEADDSIQASQAAIEALKQAATLNDKAMGFLGAGAVAKAGTLLPEGMRPATVDATNELDNLVTNSAVPQLKAIFGGNPTEGERRVLLDIAGSSSASPSVRKGIFERAIKAAERRMQFNAQKAQSLRGGTYFTQTPATHQVAPQAVQEAPKVRRYNPATGRIE